ncbi:MAG: lipopolysaccharide kinase InaA family protein [Candidatus Binatus sp.]|uniref:lipopolysaccharide kinase InaA family protein n=1 Tax=Candidatus Binatus sp. TaxID=2811406 RepID=UPI003BB0BB46
MRPPSQLKWRADPNFTTFKVKRRELVIHRDIASQAARVMRELGELTSAVEAGAGNRQSAYRLDLGDGRGLFARRCRRGGLIASILSDVYFGITPRPLTELAVTIEAMRRGIPVAKPMGAMIEWLSPVLYRGFFLTRAVRGMTLWEFVKADDDPTVRRHVLEQARAAIDIMHSKGLFHGDLNLHNLLVTQARDSFSVIIIDLDKSRLFDAPVSVAMRRANAARLIRSARKLDPSGKFLDAAALWILSRD